MKYDKELHKECEARLVELSADLAVCRRIEKDLLTQWQGIWEIKHQQDQLLIDMIKQKVPTGSKSKSVNRSIKRIKDFTPAEKVKLLKELKEMQNGS